MLDFFVDNTRLFFTGAAASLFLTLIFFMVFARAIFKCDLSTRSSFLGFVGFTISNLFFAVSLFAGLLGVLISAFRGV